MKKILFLLIAMFGLCQLADAQYAESFIKKYKEVPEVQYQNTPFKDLAKQRAAEMDADAKAEAEKAMKHWCKSSELRATSKKRTLVIL